MFVHDAFEVFELSPQYPARNSDENHQKAAGYHGQTVKVVDTELSSPSASLFKLDIFDGSSCSGTNISCPTAVDAGNTGYAESPELGLRTCMKTEFTGCEIQKTDVVATQPVAALEKWAIDCQRYAPEKIFISSASGSRMLSAVRRFHVCTWCTPMHLYLIENALRFHDYTGDAAIDNQTCVTQVRKSNRVAKAVNGKKVRVTISLGKKDNVKKSYACDVVGCKKVYTRVDSLTRHIRSHTGKKPYACKVAFCQRRFSRSDHLQGHFKRMHLGRAKESRERTWIMHNCKKISFIAGNHSQI